MVSIFVLLLLLKRLLQFSCILVNWRVRTFASIFTRMVLVMFMLLCRLMFRLRSIPASVNILIVLWIVRMFALSILVRLNMNFQQVL